VGAALAAALGGALPAAQAQDVLPVPALSGRVIDQTGVLQPGPRQALEAKLEALERERGSQVVVLVVPSTQPEDIAAYAQRVGDSWKIGRREVGDGLLIVVAVNDRRVNIQVAKALEGAIPDLAARQIISNQIAPAFRAGDYAGGLAAAVDQISARIGGEGLPAPPAGAAPGDFGVGSQGLDLQDLAIFLFVAVPIVATVLTAVFGRRLGSMLTAVGAGGLGWWFTASVLVAGLVAVAALVIVGLFGFGASRRGGLGGRGSGGPPIIWGGGHHGGGWSSGGGGSWGGGGGFGSGGGGDFGGGGASGDW
jgi:uncharacterized protein